LPYVNIVRVRRKEKLFPIAHDGFGDSEEGRLTILVDATNVQTGKTELQKNESIGSIMNTPNNPENVAEEK
jgi:hypothetical protein